MTAAFLQSELVSLIQDSKRRQSDVRTSAEKSLADLKAIQVTSETQLAGDLLRRPQFIDPFILACNSKHVKLAVTGAVCLQRLVASRAISPSRLGDVLDAYHEAATQGLDVQLKILQALPSLLQLYAAELHGEALAKTLSLCASLAGNKTPLVSGTAIATFQQLISTLFEKQPEDDTNNADDHGFDDVASVFNDMCRLIGGEQPEFLKSQGLTVPLALEVVEISLANSRFAMLDLPSCSAACSTLLIPGINHILEKSTNFSSFGRSLRTLLLIITDELDRMFDSLPEVLATILHIMDRPSGPGWRRTLCLEFMKSIISDPRLFRTLYALFDGDENKLNIIGPFMSILVRVAAEDPALIGLGRQSTIPTNSESDMTTVASANVDVNTVGSVLQASSTVTGISSRWSNIETPLLEQLEKYNPPEIPETYVYTLVLGCVASLSDGLSKFVMPLSVPNRAVLEALDTGDADGIPTRKNSQARRAEKYQRLLNPLKRDDISNTEEVQVCAKLIEECWPAVLATCSTFLNSALDSYFYHILVRTVQKLAQVSGVLELFTPRDALLTTLAKVSVPINASTIVAALHGSKLAKVDEDDGNQDIDELSMRSPSIKSPIPTTPRLSVDVSRQPLNVRNHFCLRALLNLGIALGPTLSETSWTIIIQALQQVDALMSVNPASRGASGRTQAQEDGDSEGQVNLGSEITAVGTASKRMLESTRTYSGETLEVLFKSIVKIIEPLILESRSAHVVESKSELKVTTPQHRISRSVSGMSVMAPVLYIEAEFVLRTINDLARINLHRFCLVNSKAYTWDLMGAKLLSITSSGDIDPQLRLQAANILDAISTETARMLQKQSNEIDDLDELQQLCLKMLAKQLQLLYTRENVQSILITDVDIHRRLLEALESIVSDSGDSLASGWRVVFDILQKTTRQTNTIANGETNGSSEADQHLILERTIPPAFRTVQLIVSDFLSTIDPPSFSILVQLLSSFGMQEMDLNISLTTTVLFSNLSTLLSERIEKIDLRIESSHLSSSLTDGMNGHERKATDISSLWFAIISQLCLLCKDNRGDVRNSALRVLLRILESSSSQLSSNTWNVLLQDALLPVLHDYSNKQNDNLGWHDSYTQLLQGIVNLFTQNAKSITESDGFGTSWTILITALRSKLNNQSLQGDTSVFTAAAGLLRALYPTKIPHQELTLPLIRCWAEFHPARVVVEEVSNQDALCAHARLFVAATAESNTVFEDLSTEDLNLVELALAANKQALLASMHSPYSSDVTKISPEQAAILDNLAFIKGMMTARKQDYSDFLLDLVHSILIRNTAVEVEKQKIITTSRSLKRPTLIAFMSQCIVFWRAIVKEEAENEAFLRNASVKTALTVLKQVVTTKYTNIPMNNDNPAWQNATSAIVEVLEVTKQHIGDSDNAEIQSLPNPIVQCLEAILTAPSLATKDPIPSSDRIVADEAFDIEQFSRFHTAVTPLLQRPQFSEAYRQQYIIVLFKAALVAKPWYGDLPEDLVKDPLANFKQVRRGSIRLPDFLPRTKIPYEALSALLGMLNGDKDQATDAGFLNTAKTAAPYVLLRIAHSIKAFLADQRLRQLTPPPRQLQHELNIILTKALRLKVADEAFSKLVPTAVVGPRDGMTHLRILYPLILRLKEFWVALPRLKVCAWQDNEDGVAIKDALDVWGKKLAQVWEVDVAG